LGAWYGSCSQTTLTCSKSHAALFLPIRIVPCSQIENRDFAGPDADHGLIPVAPAARLDIGTIDAAVAGQQVPRNDVQRCAVFFISSRRGAGFECF